MKSRCVKEYKEWNFYCKVAEGRSDDEVLKALRPDEYKGTNLGRSDVRSWRWALRLEARRRGLNA